MQQTTKYKFNLIETSDAFSPDALNANARAVETELARVEDAADAALAQADAAVRADFAAADAASKTALEQTLAAQKSELQNSITALQTAVGSGGKTARIAYGTYIGNGHDAYTRTLTVGFRPIVLILGGALNARDSAWWPTIILRSLTGAHSDGGGGMIDNVVWTDTDVSFRCNGTLGNNDYDTYRYVIIGETAD